MAKTPFKIGDVVRLKSGGPPMTVTSVEMGEGEAGYVIFCIWFNAKGNEKSGHYPAATLVLVDETQAP
jgi:uncharacterized protein YodC (DUF2158 family)